jgi:hypothetical protein
MKYVTTSKESEKRSSTIGHRMLTISKMQMIPEENHLIRYSITAGHYLAIMLTLLYKHVQEDCKLQTKYIDAALHASSIAQQKKKCVVFVSHGPRMINRVQRTLLS